eukprot:GILK01006180.1.p1 GENE.GILK01006180.1~~GILK01006180.1.p1  ORF type:complete len:787 (+),score=133.05 GILK01006180.1:35-2362(+)
MEDAKAVDKLRLTLVNVVSTPRTNDEAVLWRRKVLKKNVFCTLDDDKIDEMARAMTRIEFQESEFIIMQDDEADMFYLLEEGVCDVHVRSRDGDFPGEVVLQLNEDCCFGELALIRGSKRHASVRARTHVVTWALDRHRFDTILKSFLGASRAHYEMLLANCPILSEMSKYEIGLIALSMQKVEYTPGQFILTQGDPGDMFYIVETGTVVVTRRILAGQEPMEIAKLGEGDYFGELALLCDQPRAANVIADSNVSVLGITRHRFLQLFGAVEDVLKRNVQAYKWLKEKEKRLAIISFKNACGQNAPDSPVAPKAPKVRSVPLQISLSYTANPAVASHKRRGSFSRAHTVGGLASSPSELRKHLVRSSTHGQLTAKVPFTFNNTKTTSPVADNGCVSTDPSPVQKVSSPSSNQGSPTASNRRRASSRPSIGFRPSRLECDGPDEFEIVKMLQKVSYRSVALVRHMSTDRVCVMKSYNKEGLFARNHVKEVFTEKVILELTDHPLLPKLLAHFETETDLYLVMEYIPGGDFHDLLGEYTRLSEDWVRFYMAELLLVIEYLHVLGFVYRDLKPENLGLAEDGHIRLMDFNLCAIVETPENDPGLRELKQKKTCNGRRNSLPASISERPRFVEPRFLIHSRGCVGTHEYVAPEVLSGANYSSTIDWWSFGIVMYELLYGKTPFYNDGDDVEEIHYKIKFNKLVFSSEKDVPGISKDARDLIKKLLHKDPERRLGSVDGASEIRAHPFFKNIDWPLILNVQPPIIPNRTSSIANVQEATY